MKAVRVSLSLLLLTCAFAAAAAGQQVRGTVEKINANYGNIDTSFVPADLATLGVKQGDSFHVAARDKQFEVYLGETYSDVPKGDWVAFITSTGKLRIARNLDNAAQALGVKKGDAISLSH